MPVFKVVYTIRGVTEIEASDRKAAQLCVDNGDWEQDPDSENSEAELD